MEDETSRSKQPGLHDCFEKSVSWLYLLNDTFGELALLQNFKKISLTHLPLCSKSSFNRLNFRGAFFVMLIQPGAGETSKKG
jgi:hypothetical protein